MQNATPYKLLLTTFLFTLGFDQLTKEATHLFGFEVTYNTGVSLRLLETVSVEALTAFLLMLVVLLWYWLLPYWHQNPVAGGLFFGGSISNILDRIWYGAVRDWLPIPGLPIKNNLADVALFAAVVMLFFVTSNTVKRKP